MDFISACRKAISFDCTPGHGNKEFVDWLEYYCSEKGLHTESHLEFHNGIAEKNIIIRPTAQRPMEEFLLQTHLDTTEPGPFPNWIKTQCNPFDATIIDEKIYGLGSADAKLDFLAKIEALAKLKNSNAWKLPPVLLGTFGEESGMIGALKIIRKNLINSRMAIIGEPTQLKIVNAAKGIATVEIRVPFEQDEIRYREEHNLRESTSTQSKIFHGKSSHSSDPSLGENAIDKMLDYLTQIPSSVVMMEIDGGTSFNTIPSHAFLEIDVVSFNSKSVAQKISNIYKEILSLKNDFEKYHDDEFAPPQPTLNIGIIRTHSDHVFLSGNCRITPNISPKIYESWIARLEKVCADNNSNFKVTDYKKPYRTVKNTILVKACLDELRQMGLSDQTTTQPSTNEASLFSRVGIDCVCFGPGVREGNIHTAEEHVSISDLNRSIEFYERIIRRICL